MNDAVLKPFSDKFGVTIKQGSDISLARAKAAVDSGHPDFDVATVNQADYLVGLADGLWAPINYSYFRPEDLAAMPEVVRLSNGVGNIYYGNNIVFNTQLFPSNGPQPTSWADFWNVEKFP